MARRCALSTVLAALLILLPQGPSGAVGADEPVPVPAEDYPIYDLVLATKFLTSRTQLVLIRQRTATRLSPSVQEPPTLGFFRENDFFERPLPDDLLRDFVAKMRAPSRLERRLTLGVPYRLVRDDGAEVEVSLAPVPARAIQGPRPGGPPPVLGLLEVSRVGMNRQGNRALVYVGITRPDGTGAGFLIWLYRSGPAWHLGDTEVLWTLSP